MVTFTLAIACVFSVAPSWEALFNGENLDGWVIVNGAPSTWTIKDDMIICSGKPTGVMRTERMYENFILELDWRHMVTNGNAGLFIWSDPIPSKGAPFTRSIEVQVMDGKELDWYTTHGDIFSIWGAKMTPDDLHPNGYERCLPSDRRSNPSPQWNHYTVTCIDGQINLAVNGAFVSGGSNITPNKGYICLESEGTEVHFANIRIMELPPASPATTEVAEEDNGFRTLFNGVDLSGWETSEDTSQNWTVNDWKLQCGGDGEALRTSATLEHFEVMLDYKCEADESSPFVIIDGEKTVLPCDTGKKWSRYVATGKRGAVGIGSDDGPVVFCNIYIRNTE